ncbi:GNAT family N-acetyltransferase [Streptomyces sp. NPDC046870]|uniref:GNAT family N-acetyltransferase n=1 Tax=Streptomyces sp. NPDC046870 TaxID=3155135 RepID=UPI003455844B
MIETCKDDPEGIVAGAHVLDNPIWHSLNGAHQSLALTDGRAARYPADVSPFMTLPADATGAEWEALGRLAGPDPVLIMDAPDGAPPSWTLVRRVPLYQMVADEPALGRRKEEEPAFPIEPLHSADTGAMRELAAATKPGPFEARTAQLGVFLGARDGGKLIAMAGERMRPDGWTEISAVCTHPDYRGRGLARALTERMIDGILARGERPFLHVLTANDNAVRLYKAMGFTIRRTAANSLYRPA